MLFMALDTVLSQLCKHMPIVIIGFICFQLFVWVKGGSADWGQVSVWFSRSINPQYIIFINTQYTIHQYDMFDLVINT